MAQVEEWRRQVSVGELLAPRVLAAGALVDAPGAWYPKAIDLLARELYDALGTPEKRPWVSPYPTSHMFFASAEPGARDLRLEAT